MSLSGSNVSYVLPDGTALFEGLSFSFGQKIYGLIGPNGVGKTTFLKLLVDELNPSQGQLNTKGSLILLPQMRSFSNGITDFKTIEEVLGVQEILHALKKVEDGDFSSELAETIGDKWDLKSQLQKIFQSLDIDYLNLSQDVASISGGEWMRVHFARLLLDSPSTILLDEPTNHLDQNGRKAVFEFIQSWRRCMIIVSHDRELLSQVDEIAELSNQGLRFYGGNYDFYLSEREKESAALEHQIGAARQEYKKQKSGLKESLERQQRRMAQGQKKGREGGVPKIIARMQKQNAQFTLGKIKTAHEDRLFQADQRVRQLSAQVKTRNQIKIDIPETLVPNKKELLEFKEFNFNHAGASQFLWDKPINFHLIGPARIRLNGANGAGKSTLMKLLMQSLWDNSPIQGEHTGCFKLKTRRIAYLDQNMEILGNPETSLLTRFSIFTPHLSESERRIRLGRFLFNQQTSLKKISALSGGEQMRAALACALFSEVAPELLILDEPTNNLDVDSVEQFESALSNFQGALIVISHDIKFLENLRVTEELLIAPNSRRIQLIKKQN